MPFDIFTAAAMRDELAVKITGARVDKIIQTSQLAVSLRMWSKGWSGSVVISADASSARVYATEAKLSKGMETPPPFLMLLRKYCTSGRVTRVEQVPLDRILTLDISQHEHGDIRLIAEIMGNRSNVILVDADGTILGALRLIGARQSRTRRIFPHVRYEPPGDQPRSKAFGEGAKLDPTADEDLPKIRAAIGQIPPEMTVENALVGVLRGCSPAIARDIRARMPALSTGASLPAALIAAVEEQYDLLRTRAWTPIVIRRDGVPVGYRAYAEPPVPDADPCGSMSAAIERVSEGLESTDALQAARKRVQSVIDGRATEIQSRLASLRKGLESATTSDALLEAGNLVLGFQYQLELGQDLLEIPEMDTRIDLDPELGPVENAERYFKRYRKARDAGKRLPALIGRAESDAQFVEELSAFVDLAETTADLTRIEGELHSRFNPKPERAKSRPASRLGRVLTVDLPDGSKVLVGRSARQNEEVTFKLAGRGDIWLHARGVPGAHVVLKGDEGSVGPAASLAAYYSKARGEKAVDVIVARVKDVHRFPGGAPGQVTVRESRTVRVSPESIDELAISSRER